MAMMRKTDLECEQDRAQDNKDNGDAPDSKEHHLPLADLPLAIHLNVLQVLEVPHVEDRVAPFCPSSGHTLLSFSVQPGHFKSK